MFDLVHVLANILRFIGESGFYFYILLLIVPIFYFPDSPLILFYLDFSVVSHYFIFIQNGNSYSTCLFPHIKIKVPYSISVLSVHFYSVYIILNIKYYIYFINHEIKHTMFLLLFI